MDKLTIYYSFKGNGILFGPTSYDYESLKKLFPNAQPAKSIFVEYDRQSDFKNYHAQLENYIFPAIAGFPVSEDLKKIKVIEFMMTPGRTVTYTIKNNIYEQEIQPICG
ncbi:MAG: hypothetical protein JNL70_16405 [Saprospiraceae bacterium]|nr:hypothetical protein [Saprospiraceae bacterium]